MHAVSALIPVFTLILLGYALHRINFPDPAFWPMLEKLTYYLLFPALLVHNLSTAPLRGLSIGQMGAALIGVILVLALLLVLLRPALPISGPAFSSVFQGSLRFNTYVGLAVAAAINPLRGLSLAALALALMVPLLNVLSVLALARYASHTPVPWRNIVRQVVRNPLIIACAAGIFLNWLRIELPGSVQQSLSLSGRAALPLGLLAVGAGLRFRGSLSGTLSLTLSSIFKLMLFPLLSWMVCKQLGADAETTRITVMFGALPTATSAYILARQMGGDHVLMANMITLQTALAMLSLPLLLTIV